MVSAEHATSPAGRGPQSLTSQPLGSRHRCCQEQPPLASGSQTNVPIVSLGHIVAVGAAPHWAGSQARAGGQCACQAHTPPFIASSRQENVSRSPLGHMPG